MRFQVADLSALTNFVKSAMQHGAINMMVSGSYLIRKEDLKVIALTYKDQYFLSDNSPNKNAYNLAEVRELLYKFYPQNENIRPFVKYNVACNDFIVDMDKMYRVYDRIDKLNSWQEVRQEFQQASTFLEQRGDIAFVEIINRNLKRLCDFDGGYLFAMDWVKRNPDRHYILPHKHPVYASEAQRRLTYDGMIRITNRIQEKKDGKHKVPRHKL